jgi:hypothetical protein
MHLYNQSSAASQPRSYDIRRGHNISMDMDYIEFLLAAEQIEFTEK